MPIEVGQHNREIQGHAAHWRRKPLSTKIYSVLFATRLDDILPVTKRYTNLLGAGTPIVRL